MFDRFEAIFRPEPEFSSQISWEKGTYMCIGS